MAISVSFPFSRAAQPGAWGPASLDAGFLYRILSPTLLIPNWSDLQNSQSGAWGLSLLGAVFLYRILSPTDWISCSLSYIIVQRPPSSRGRQNRPHSTRPRSRLYSDIPCTDAFPILTVRPGRRSICNIYSVLFECCLVSECSIICQPIPGIFVTQWHTSAAAVQVDIGGLTTGNKLWITPS